MQTVCVLNEVITKTQTEWETNSIMQTYGLHTAVLLYSKMVAKIIYNPCHILLYYSSFFV